MNLLELRKMKDSGRKISMVTCYDYWSARILNDSNVDILLVGDSLAMVMHGHPNTIPATAEVMALHVEAVAKGAPGKFVVADMPFLGVRSGLERAMHIVDSLMKAGAHALKIEGIDGHESIVEHIVQSGVPVMGHIGLVPQSIHQLGGYRVQGREEKQASALKDQAARAEQCGCFSIVLECLSSNLASEITRGLQIPTIGIGAGAGTDGQVLVLHDLLGFYREVQPRFVRQYLHGYDLLLEALNRFDGDVKAGEFPAEKESYR